MNTRNLAKYAPFVLRLGLGIVFAVHGYQKMFIQGFDGVAEFFASVGIPAAMFFAYIVTILELIGGIMLIVGLLTKWVSTLFALDMIVALLVVHAQNGFYVSGGGYEFVLILLAGSISLILSGPGLYSIDKKTRR